MEWSQENRKDNSVFCIFCRFSRKNIIPFLLVIIFFILIYPSKNSFGNVSLSDRIILSKEQPAVSLLPDPGGKLEIKGLGSISKIDLLRRVPLSMSSVSRTVLTIQKDSGEFRNFFKAMQLHWSRKDQLKVKFSWNTKEKDVVSAIWQVSTLRFPSDLSNWKVPPGIIASGNTSLKDVQTGKFTKVFYVDFSEFAPLPGTFLKDVGSIKLSREPASVKKLKKINLKKTGSGISQKIVTEKENVQIQKGHLERLKEKEPSTFNMVYYVRVVTLGSDGKPSGIPSQAVRILYGDPVNDGTIEVKPSAFEKPLAVHPEINIEIYVPIQNQATDAMYHVIAVKDIPNVFGGPPLVKKGQKFDLRPKQDEKGFWESVGDFFSGAVDWASGAVNWVSEAYDSIKKKAVDIACSVAGERFRGAFEMGVNIGMAAMGVPPGIPNMDELTDMGVDYLVEVATEQAIGIGVDPVMAKEAAEKGVTAFVDEMEHQANGGSSGSLFKPDPDYYYRPAFLKLRITNNKGVPTQSVTGKVSVTVKDGTWYEDLFHKAYFRIPSLKPGESFSMPVYLEENMENKFEDHDYYAGMQRFWTRYLMPAKVTVLTGIYETWDPDRPSGGAGLYKYENFEEVHQVLDIPDCREVLVP